MARRSGSGRGGGRASVGDEIAAGIRDGSIRVPASVAAAVLEKPAKTRRKPGAAATEKEPDALLEARRAAVREREEASFSDPKPRPGSAGAGVICRTTRQNVVGEMNNTEGAYAELLEARKRAGQITDWLYEEHRVKVGVGSWYTPDFFVTLPDGRAYFVEVKPFRYEKGTGKVIRVANEDAVQKVKGCVLRHPFPVLWALGRKRTQAEGGGYEWREEWQEGPTL